MEKEDLSRRITAENIRSYEKYLREEERAEGTVEKYMRDVSRFAKWSEGRAISKELVNQWKAELQHKGYAPRTINSMLAAINSFLEFMKLGECKAKYLKVQQRLFRDSSRDMSHMEYRKLIDTANAMGKERLALLIETIGSLGLRVSEVKHITVEVARQGTGRVYLKGKDREILLSSKLSRKLLKYAKHNNINEGEIFITKTGKGLSRRQIWAEMKALCKYAGIVAGKVFPHNLRHLFAVTFYKHCKDIARLADVLGHSSIETTRIYLATTGEEQLKQLDRLGLVT